MFKYFSDKIAKSTGVSIEDLKLANIITGVFLLEWLIKN